MKIIKKFKNIRDKIIYGDKFKNIILIFFGIACSIFGVYEMATKQFFVKGVLFVGGFITFLIGFSFALMSLIDLLRNRNV